MLDIGAILNQSVVMPENGRCQLGDTRQGRPVFGFRLGHGPRRVSLIAGCHADEPVGPAMLERLTSWLARQPSTARCLEEVTWFIVPHVHPDGEARNHRWTRPGFAPPGGDLSHTIDLAAYLRHVVRDLPGDDIEFGFPRHADDADAGPENRAVAGFMAEAAPIHLHASFHGMAFAAGPWFLMEHSWADRTLDMRRHLRRRVGELGYRLHDVDRRGEKGFHRIDEGFTSRPDSRAMAAHFESLGDPATANLFRPSSMELAVSLGGDPLTLVSEMPLFIAPAEVYASAEIVRPPAIRDLRALAADPRSDGASLRQAAAELGIRPMPLADQMRLQLEFLAAGLRATLPASSA